MNFNKFAQKQAKDKQIPIKKALAQQIRIQLENPKQNKQSIKRKSLDFIHKQRAFANDNSLFKDLSLINDLVLGQPYLK